MKLRKSTLVIFAMLGAVLLLALEIGAIFGALGRHSVRFPLNYSNQAADSAWALYLGIKGGKPATVPTSGDVTIITTFTQLHGRVFSIPISSRGGEGGAATSIGDALLLLTHDGRFFAGSANTGFRKIDAIVPPDNGFQQYFDATHRAPYDPAIQNYANFRYNDIAFFNSPASSGLLISYTYFDGARSCYANRVSRFDLADKNVSAADIKIKGDDWRLVFETKPCLPLRAPGPSIYVQEAGGRLAVDSAAGTVYLASGTYDASNPERDIPLAQDPGNDYGKVIVIDLASGKSQHLTMGHRNPQGITLDGSGRLWIVDHGPRAGDELDRIIPGRNYGWPLAIYGTGYDQRPYPGVLSLGRHDGFEEPTLAWLPGIAPGSIMTVRDFHPTWNGDLLVGALRGQKLVHIRLVGDRVVFAEDIPVGLRVRHLLQQKDGSIALWNGKNQLTIFTAQEPPSVAETAQKIINKLKVPARVRTAAQIELGKCMQCHSLDASDNTKAPSLVRVFGSSIGSTGYADYSTAMKKLKNSGSVWTRERLNAFLHDPDRAIPGTVMPDPGINDAEIRAALVEALAALRPID